MYSAKGLKLLAETALPNGDDAMLHQCARQLEFLTTETGAVE